MMSDLEGHMSFTDSGVLEYLNDDISDEYME